ncbi:MAG: ATP-binding protein [Candidatus Limnocylindrales bacterium]
MTSPQHLRVIRETDEQATLPAPGGVEPGVREFLGAIGVALYTTDADGQITYFNEAAADLWGRRPLLGEEWCGSFRLYWPDGRPMRHDECPMAQTLREGQPNGGTAIAERPDGTRVMFEAHPSPLRNDEGKLIGAINVLVDVTERQAAREKIQATADELQRSNAVKDEFLGLVSHELRTPVTTIYGNAQLLLQRKDSLGEVAGLMIDDIAEDSEHLLAVIENLLLLTRVEAGAVPESEPQLVEHSLRRKCAAFEKRRGRPITVTSTSRDHVVVDADRTYLDLIIGNLLSNADKYSSPEQPIEALLEVVDSEVVISVLDRGIGFTHEDAERIFTPFYRSPLAKRRASGMGIGLTVCNRIVSAQGGRMFARPRDGGGAEVGFQLPLMHDPGD